METEVTRKKRKKALIAAGACVFALLLLSGLAFMAAPRVIVKDGDLSHFRARIIALSGNAVLLIRNSRRHDSRKGAFEDRDSAYLPSVRALDSIAQIEVLPDEDGEDLVGGVSAARPIHLGNFRINAAGNEGFLYLRAKDGVPFGSIRFPGWGNGAFEPLKGVWIAEDRIRFIRSVTTAEEMRKTGAQAAFVQEYFGAYREGGNVIEGNYRVRGRLKSWYAFRAR
jgi:hypothetical protein